MKKWRMLLKQLNLSKNLFFLKIGVSDTIEKKVKAKEGGFLGTLLGTFGTIFFENLLPGKGVIRGGDLKI